MNGKKYFVAAIGLSTVLLALAVSVSHPFAFERQPGPNDLRRRALAGPSGKFGPVIDTVLPSARTGASVDILDLETGCARRQPPWEYFNSGADAITAWIRSNRLNISCSPWPGFAACVTYDMIIVPVEAKCWEETTEQELLDNPALAPVRHSPRRLLVLRNDQPDTYIFRTGEGTLGMLRLVGLSEHGRGVKIRYKLINPAKSGKVGITIDTFHAFSAFAPYAWRWASHER
ncbi:MAG TPA: hypothetical protein VN578_07270 [Candidatus Binatia bacterium]|nr:hypothetical protein [Candidatus Binatia bacterium]